MATNEELFRKMMRFSREVRMKRFRPCGGPQGEGKGCGMPPMPGMPPVHPMRGMPPMPGMPQMPPH